MNTASDLDLINRVIQSRRHGYTYVPACYGTGPRIVGNLRISWTSYGRSQQGGGHKYKMYAHYALTGRVCLTRHLRLAALA